MTRKPPLIDFSAAERLRCEREIESITAQLRAGSTDMHGLLLALKDWGCELRLIEEEEDDWADDPDEDVYGYHFHSQEEREEWEREWHPEWDEVNG